MRLTQLISTMNKIILYFENLLENFAAFDQYTYILLTIKMWFKDSFDSLFLILNKFLAASGFAFNLNDFYNFKTVCNLLQILDPLIILLPVLLSVAFMTIIERKQLAAHQRRIGPVKCIRNTLRWVKLSNSGNILKAMIPNFIRNNISG